MEIIIIAAVSENNVIGKGGKLPWHISADLKRFKRLTIGSPIIMGRKTFESIGRPLFDRKNIVITHNLDFSADGVVVCHSFEKALEACSDYDKVFIIGGYSIFKEAVGFADKMEITRVHKKVEGDTFFPEIDWGEWEETASEDHKEFSFVSYRRK